MFLSSPPTSFELIEWKDNMWRWLRAAQVHLPFDVILSNMYNKMDRQWHTYISDKLAVGGPYTAKDIIDWIEDKNLEQVPQIKRLSNCHQLKKQPGEDIVNYETRIKIYREVAKYDELTPEQSRVLYAILTSGDKKFEEECLKQVTNKLHMLTSAILPRVWLETHATTLNAPDSMAQVNNDSLQRKTVGQIDSKNSSKKGPPPKCPTCGKMHKAPCRKASKQGGSCSSCSSCRNNKRPDHVINNHTDAECWDIYPEKMPQT